MSWSPPAPGTTGELYAAATYNTDVVGNLSFLKGVVDDNGHVISNPAVMITTAAIVLGTDVVLASGTITISLPVPSLTIKRFIAIKNVGTGVVTVNVAGGVILIDFSTTFVLQIQGHAQFFYSDGTQYWIF